MPACNVSLVFILKSTLLLNSWLQYSTPNVVVAVFGVH